MKLFPGDSSVQPRLRTVALVQFLSLQMGTLRLGARGSSITLGTHSGPGAELVSSWYKPVSLYGLTDPPLGMRRLGQSYPTLVAYDSIPLSHV